MLPLITPQGARVLQWLTPLALFAAVFAFSDDVKLHLECFLEALAVTLASVSLLCIVSELLAPYFGRVQDDVEENRSLMPLEFLHTCGTILVFSQLVAWPLQRVAQGKPTAFVDTLEESMPRKSVVLFVLKMCLVVLGADCFTFFKHYLLHSTHLRAIHMTHHFFKSPSALAGFALHTAESLATFFPVLFFGLPPGALPFGIELAIHGPTYLPLVASWGLLNVYLHAGYKIELLERILPLFYLNTSVFHNWHHEGGSAGRGCHFGELLILWDVILGTDPMRRKNWRRNYLAAPVGAGLLEAREVIPHDFEEKDE